MHELIICYDALNIASLFSFDTSNYLDLILPTKLEVLSLMTILRSSLEDNAPITNDVQHAYVSMKELKGLGSALLLGT